jgi:hypothetical protein
VSDLLECIPKFLKISISKFLYLFPAFYVCKIGIYLVLNTSAAFHTQVELQTFVTVTFISTISELEFWWGLRICGQRVLAIGIEAFCGKGCNLKNDYDAINIC